MKYYRHYVRCCFFALSCIIITLLMIGCVKTVLKRGSLKAKVINGEIIGHIDTIDDHGNAVTNIPENLFAKLEWQIGETLEVCGAILVIKMPFASITQSVTCLGE